VVFGSCGERVEVGIVTVPGRVDELLHLQRLSAQPCVSFSGDRSRSNARVRTHRELVEQRVGLEARFADRTDAPPRGTTLSAPGYSVVVGCEPTTLLTPRRAIVLHVGTLVSADIDGADADDHTLARHEPGTNARFPMTPGWIDTVFAANRRGDLPRRTVQQLSYAPGTGAKSGVGAFTFPRAACASVGFREVDGDARLTCCGARPRLTVVNP